MSIMERIERDLKTSCYTAIFELSEKEKSKIDEIRELLKNETDYLDIIFDKSDLRKLTKDIDRIDDYNHNWFYIQQNLYDIIIEKFGLGNTFFVDYDSLASELNEIAKKQGKNGFRIHIFLDEVTMPSEQKAINNLINSGCLNVMGYTSGTLKTYFDSNGDSIYHSTFISSQAKIYELKCKYNLGLEEGNEEND